MQNNSDVTLAEDVALAEDVSLFSSSVFLCLFISAEGHPARARRA